MARIRESGTAIVTVKAGQDIGMEEVRTENGVEDCQVMLTARASRPRKTPDKPGPLFVPFSTPLQIRGSIIIWVRALDLEPVDKDIEIKVDWAVVEP